MRLRAVLAAILAAPAMAVLADPAQARTKSFQTPSHNIYCLYMSTQGPGPWIRCDVLSLNDTGFTVKRTGRARRIRITDSVVRRRASVLRYGRTLRVGPFTCRSRQSGLTCRSRTSGHGFTLSRRRQRRF